MPEQYLKVGQTMTTGKRADVDLLVKIISDSRAGWDLVAICGRAIAATGRLNLWVLGVGKNEHDAQTLADVLLAFGDASERIDVVWNSFLESGDGDTFHAEFSSLVMAMETAIP